VLVKIRTFYTCWSLQKGEQKISNNVFCAKEILLCFYLNKINIIYKHIQQHKARLTRFIYTAARLGPPLLRSIFLYKKNIHAMEFNDYFRSAPEHSKEFSTMVVMNLIRSDRFNACKAT
jgi:hypothetical protein